MRYLVVATDCSDGKMVGLTPSISQFSVLLTCSKTHREYLRTYTKLQTNRSYLIELKTFTEGKIDLVTQRPL